MQSCAVNGCIPSDTTMNVSERMQMSIFSESVDAKCERSATLDRKWQQQHEPCVLGTTEDGSHAFRARQFQLHQRYSNVHAILQYHSHPTLD